MQKIFQMLDRRLVCQTNLGSVITWSIFVWDYTNRNTARWKNPWEILEQQWAKFAFGMLINIMEKIWWVFKALICTKLEYFSNCQYWQNLIVQLKVPFFMDSSFSNQEKQQIRTAAKALSDAIDCVTIMEVSSNARYEVEISILARSSTHFLICKVMF